MKCDYPEKLGEKFNLGIFGQSFVQMDDSTHPHQDQSVWPVHVPGRPGVQIYDSEKILIAQLELTHFSLAVFTAAFFIKSVDFTTSHS